MTTSPPTSANARPDDDPLEQLEAQIRRGAVTGPVQPRAEPRARQASDEAPLKWLEARLEEASDPAMWAEILLDSIRHAEGPLADFDDWIRRARDLETPAEGYPEEIDAENDGPVERLQAAIQHEVETIGGRSSVVTRESPSSSDTATAQPAPSNAEAVIGREVLKMLENRDLSGSARSEAARLLATALQEPDEETLREVLEILLFE
jgi:hypothetical protein